MTCVQRVAEILGSGYSEKVYENALYHELTKAGMEVVQQQRLPIVYDGVTVGLLAADLLVDGRIIVELKSVRWLDDLHLAQCANYLKATQSAACLLINFGAVPPEVKKLYRKTV
jgi:GxxExxY protein